MTSWITKSSEMRKILFQKITSSVSKILNGTVLFVLNIQFAFESESNVGNLFVPLAESIWMILSIWEDGKTLINNQAKENSIEIDFHNFFWSS